MIKHRILRQLASTLGICALLLSSAARPAEACTGIRLIAVDGTVVYARTLEFGIDLHSEIMMVPRGYARTGTTPDGTPGLKWTAKYASVGMNGVGLPVLFDGLNEKGLAAGLSLRMRDHCGKLLERHKAIVSHIRGAVVP